MATITIPKKLIENDDLVILPRKKYEELLRVAAKENKRIYNQFDKDLDETIAEYKAGKFFGPFNTIENGIKFLKTRKVSKIKK